jgi:hypothetical protein
MKTWPPAGCGVACFYPEQCAVRVPGTTIVREPTAMNAGWVALTAYGPQAMAKGVTLATTRGVISSTLCRMGGHCRHGNALLGSLDFRPKPSLGKPKMRLSPLPPGPVPLIKVFRSPKVNELRGPKRAQADESYVGSAAF